MMKYVKFAALAVVFAPTLALAELGVGDELGVSEAAILAALETQGYTVNEVEVESGEIEVEAQSGGQSFEIEVSPKTGLILAVYQEDEDDDKDDDDDDDDDKDDS